MYMSNEEEDHDGGPHVDFFNFDHEPDIIDFMEASATSKASSSVPSTSTKIEESAFHIEDTDYYSDDDTVERDIFEECLIDEDTIRKNVFDETMGVSDADEDVLSYEESFLQDGCKCKENCVTKFVTEEILDSRHSCLEMKYNCSTHVNHHHIHIKGALNALTRTSPLTMQKEHSSKARIISHSVFQFRGIGVCKSFFQFVNGINKKELQNVRETFLKSGVEEKAHGNTKKIVASKVRDLEDWKHAVKFIRTFGQQNGLILPGRVPEFRNFIDLFVLPSSMSKKEIHAKYILACEKLKMKPLGLISWYRVWGKLCSNVVIQKPRPDLCVVCQNSCMTLSKLHNLPEEMKQARIQESLNHLNRVAAEREHYYSVIKRCREALPERLANVTPMYRSPLSYTGEMHYSFDYAQQVHIPYDSQQVGPLYFLTGYKVGLFGVSIEPINQFVLYVIPEACAIGKGSNSVLSFLHHCLENFSFGATHLLLHADNCCGQNKNKYLLHYCNWRVMLGLNESVSPSFLPVGHTKFDVDTRLGHFKWRWIKSSAHNLKDVCRIAAQTSNTSVVLVGNERGDSNVPQYDWSTFFERHGMSTVKNIRSYHHFRAEVERPGIIVHRQNLDTPEQSTVICSDTCSIGSDYPEVSQPVGLSAIRKLYLFKTIRPYVKEGSKKILCPKPN